MRVLLIHNYYQQRGGEDVIFEQEVDLLRENGISVETLIFTNDRFNGTKLGTMRSAVQALYNVQSGRRINDAIARFRPNVVHIHNLFYTASASIIRVAKANRIPVVMTLHNYRLVCVNGLLMRAGKIPCEDCLTKTVALSGIQHGCFRDSRVQSAHLSTITLLHRLTGIWRSVDRFLVVTEFARQKVLDSSLNLKPEQVYVKPNFVADMGLVDPQERRNFFLYVGRMTFEKGIDVVLESAEMDGFPLDIIGDGPLKGDVEQRVAQTPTIRYHGAQPRRMVLEMLKQCRALIVPSRWYEGLPTVILEAFATGTPVICSDQQNLNQIVKDGFTGLLFRTGDSVDLGRVIRNYSQNPDYHQWLGRNAYREFQTRYTREVALQSILSVYEGLIDTKKWLSSVE